MVAALIVARLLGVERRLAELWLLVCDSSANTSSSLNGMLALVARYTTLNWTGGLYHLKDILLTWQDLGGAP